jgi:hypothetical protein
VQREAYNVHGDHRVPDTNEIAPIRLCVMNAQSANASRSSAVYNANIVMMSYTTRREFLRTVGGFGMALGAHPLLGLEKADSRLSFERTKARPASSVGLISEFNARDFQQPEAVLWPAYFWLWNATLDPDRLRAQLEDMAAHDARSVCMLSMPHAFRPDSTTGRVPKSCPGLER